MSIAILNCMHKNKSALSYKFVEGKNFVLKKEGLGVGKNWGFVNYSYGFFL